ncbi:MAG: hypothetical protein AAGE80_08285 [Pseudomonadota bacterium]
MIGRITKLAAGVSAWKLILGAVLLIGLVFKVGQWIGQSEGAADQRQAQIEADEETRSEIVEGIQDGKSKVDTDADRSVLDRLLRELGGE